MPGLTLSFSGYSLNILRFAGSKIPRSRIGSYQLSHSAQLVPTRQGTLAAPPHLWRFEALLSAAEADTLNRIYAAYLAAPGPITIDDYTSLYCEAGTRSRSLASGETTELSDAATTCYYARFSAEFSEVPDLSREGNYVNAALQFLETEVVAA